MWPAHERLPNYCEREQTNSELGNSRGKITIKFNTWHPNKGKRSKNVDPKQVGEKKLASLLDQHSWGYKGLAASNKDDILLVSSPFGDSILGPLVNLQLCFSANNTTSYGLHYALVCSRFSRLSWNPASPNPRAVYCGVCTLMFDLSQFFGARGSQLRRESLKPVSMSNWFCGV